MNLPKLLKLIDKHFDEEELKTLCFVLQVDYDGLPAKGKSGKVRELVKYCKRNGTLEDLIKECQDFRQNVVWGQVVQFVENTSEGDEIDPLRSAIWNALYKSLWNQPTFLNTRKKTGPTIYKFSEKLWIDFFNMPMPTRPKEPQAILDEMYRHYVSYPGEEWIGFVEFTLNYWNDLRHYAPYLINDEVNQAFRNQGSDLRYVPEYAYGRFSSGSIKPNPDDIYPSQYPGTNW